MFGIGGSEILLILVIALMVLGPKSLPQIARSLGKALGEFRRVSTDFQRTLNTEVELDEREKLKKDVETEYFSKTETPKSKESASEPSVVDSAQSVASAEADLSNKDVSADDRSSETVEAGEKAPV